MSCHSIKIDHSPSIIDAQLEKKLVAELLQFAMTLYNMNEDQISIFTQSYSPASHSTAAAEVEVRAKRLECGDDPDSRREHHMKKYEKFFNNFLKSNDINKGVVFTLTLEDWSVKFISYA